MSAALDEQVSSHGPSLARAGRRPDDPVAGSNLGGANALDLELAVAVALAGFFLPDALLSSAVAHRRDTIRLSVADVVDELTICVEAGLGFDAAMTRVARATAGPLPDALHRTLQDIRAGAPRTRALTEMAERVDVPELRHLVLAIVQAEKHGIPVADTLRIQAAEMRLRRSQYAEERAMKLPVKMIFPTLLHIMPALFVVIVGPAVIRIFDTLG